MIRPFSLAFSLLLFVLGSGPADGQTRLLDDFDQAAGERLVDHQWTLIRGGTDIVYTDGGLAFSVYPHSDVGNAAGLIADGGQEVRRPFGARTDGAVYAAFLVQMQTVSDVFNDGIFFYLGPDDTTIFNRFATIYANEDGAGNVRFGIRKGSGISFTGYDYALGTTYLLVLKYQFLPDTDDDLLSLWIDPDLNELEALVPPKVTTDSGGDAPGIAEVVLSQISGGPTATLDGLHISTAWELPLAVFLDGFETADTSSWSSVVVD